MNEVVLWGVRRRISLIFLCYLTYFYFFRDRMQQSAMYDLCLGMRQVSQEFLRLQLTYDEFLSMKVLLLLSTGRQRQQHILINTLQ